MHIWRELKRLSNDFVSSGNSDLQKYGEKSQNIERLTAKLVVNICGLNRDDVNKLRSNDEIDDFDYETMRFCTWERPKLNSNTPKNKSEEIIIHWADYGIDDRITDLTGIIREIIKSGQKAINGNNKLGGDPAPGLILH